ncbi:MAG: heavy metal-binding domain-containing protein, partial [Gammaproteobacteria bacterium]
MEHKHQDRDKHEHQHSHGHEHGHAHGHKDPVCGMDVAEDAPHHTEHAGQRYYFCSAHCLHKFQHEPQRYIVADRPRETQSGALQQADAFYTCPMHPEVRQEGPGSCPKCGMALEPLAAPATPATKTEYVCPMHPEIVRDRPGDCPICGMALEPRTVSAEEEGANPELEDMTRRFWVSTVLAVPVFVLAMVADLAPAWLPEVLSMRAVQWIEFVLATPVVLWGGWPFFVRGWRSVVTWNLNMFTLIGLGVAVAWAYSVVALLFPGIFP